MHHLHIGKQTYKAKVQPSDKKSEKKELKLEKNSDCTFCREFTLARECVCVCVLGLCLTCAHLSKSSMHAYTLPPP